MVLPILPRLGSIKDTMCVIAFQFPDLKHVNGATKQSIDARADFAFVCRASIAQNSMMVHASCDP